LACQPLSLISVEPLRITGGGVFRRPAGRLRRAQDAADSRIAGDPFQDRLRYGPDTDLVEEPAINPLIEDAKAQRAVDQHAQAQLCSQRQHASLGIAQSRIVGKLDRGVAPRERRGTCHASV
jgi:hypothetical protein